MGHAVKRVLMKSMLAKILCVLKIKVELADALLERLFGGLDLSFSLLGLWGYVGYCGLKVKSGYGRIWSTWHV